MLYFEPILSQKRAIIFGTKSARNTAYFSIFFRYFFYSPNGVAAIKKVDFYLFI
jgi:hypothetical protein